MPTIKLKSPWTYRSPALTADYPAGEHEVSDAVADAFAAAFPFVAEPETVAEPTRRTRG